MTSKGNLNIFDDDSDDDSGNVDSNVTTSTSQNTGGFSTSTELGSDAPEPVQKDDKLTTENEESETPPKAENSQREKLQIGKSEILELLKVSNFDKDVSECSVSFEGNCIVLDGSKTYITKGKIKVFEKIREIEDCRYEVCITNKVAGILQTAKGSAYLQKKSSAESFPCAFCVRQEGSECFITAVACCAHNNDLITAVSGIKDEFSGSVISCEGSDSQCFTSQKWKDLVDQLSEEYLVHIEFNASKKQVDVEGLKLHLESASGKLRSFLKENMAPTITWVVGGKANCLKLSPKLQKELMSIKDLASRSGGSLSQTYQESSCCITVSGVDDAEGKIQLLIGKICEGKLDFEKMASDDKEIALISKNLKSSVGKSFIRGFEEKNGIGVDVYDSPDQVTMTHAVSMPQLTGLQENMKRGSSMPSLDSIDSDSDTDCELHFHIPVHKPICVTVNSVNIKLSKGSVAKSKASVLVNVMARGSLWKHGEVAKSFLRSAGRHGTLQKDFEDECNSADDDDDVQVVMTQSSGDLTRLCDYVCHVVISNWKKEGSSEKFKASVQRVYELCEEHSARSVAIPAIGSGKILKYPSSEIADCLVTEAYQKSGSWRYLRSVEFVIYDDKDFRAVKQSLQRLPVYREGKLDSPPLRRRKGSMGHMMDVDRSWTIEREYMPTCMVDVTLYADSAESLKACQRALAQEIKTRFLMQEKIAIPVGIQLSGELIKKVYQTTEEKRVILQVSQQSGVISVKGNPDHAIYVANEIRKLLMDVRPKENTRLTRTSKPQRWKGPRNRRGSEKFWTEVEEYQTPPLYWKKFRGGYPISDLSKFHSEDKGCYILDVDEKSFSVIEDLVNKTWESSLVGQGADAKNLSHSDIKITKIQRVENLKLLQYYVLKRCEMIRKLKKNECKELTALQNDQACQKGPIKTTAKLDKLMKTDLYPEINEHYLFHGTKADSIDNIAERGIDPRRSRKAMFGSGVYTCESATKADQYTDDNQNRQTTGLKMILCRVLLGEMFVTPNPVTYKNPPCMTCKKDCVTAGHEMYDSIVADGKWLFREFVVYDSYQSYPEYIITYDRV